MTQLKSSDGGRRPGRPAIDRRHEILAAAQRLYETIGFEKTTTADIARALGMSPANLYRSFASRQDIDAAIAGRTLATIEDAAWTAARRAAQDPALAFQDMAVIVLERTAEMLLSEGRLHRLCAIATQERWPVVETFVHGLRGAVRHIVMEGQAQGRFRVTDPDRTAAAMVAAMMGSWHPLMIEIYRAEDLRGQTLAVAELLLRGLSIK